MAEYIPGPDRVTYDTLMPSEYSAFVNDVLSPNTLSLRATAESFQGFGVISESDFNQEIADKIIRSTLTAAVNLEQANRRNFNAIPETPLVIREGVKRSTFPLVHEKVKVTLRDGTQKDISIRDLKLQRYFEGRLDLALKIDEYLAENAKDPNSQATKDLLTKVRETLGALEASLAGNVVSAFKEDLANLVISYPELKPQSIKPNNTELKQDPKSSKGEIQALKDISGKDLSWLASDTLEKLVNLVSKTDATSLVETNTQRLSELQNALQQFLLSIAADKQTGTSSAENAAIIGKGLDEKRAQEIKATIDFILNRNRQLTGETASGTPVDIKNDKVFKSWQRYVQNYLRVNDLPFTEILAAVGGAAVGAGVSRALEPEDYKKALSKISELQNITNNSGVHYEGSDTYNEDLRKAQEEYLKSVYGELEKKAPKDTAKEVVGVSTYKEIMAADPEKYGSEAIYKWAKVLWSELFARVGEVTQHQNKSGVNNQYQRIIDTLRKRGEEANATYLEDRRNMFDALSIASGSALNMDYDALLEGGNGWLGAQVPANFNEGTPLRLLYGYEVNSDFLSANPEEQERLNIIGIGLPIICDFYSDQTGEYHATAQFTDAKKAAFKKAVKKEILDKTHQSSLSQDQEEGFDLLWELQIFLDLRTYYALPEYMAGWSPEDNIGKTIGNTAKRFANGKGMYIICGKGEQFVNPALLVSKFAPELEQTISLSKSDTKKDNYLFSYQATNIWDQWYTNSLDEDVENENERVAFTRKDGVNPVPTLAEAFWTPHKTGGASPVSPKTRDLLIAAAKPERKLGRPVNLEGYLKGSKAIEEYVAHCEKGFKPSGDMKKDTEQIRKVVEEVALKISPAKALSTANARYLANSLYMFVRFSCIAFTEEYRGKEKDWFRYYVRFVETIRSTILAAPTFEITISNDQLPSAFVKKYNLPLAADGTIKISDYALALMSSGEEAKDGPRIFIERSGITGSIKQNMREALQAQPRRMKNNQDKLNELRGEGEPIVKKLKDKIKGKFRGGQVSTTLKHNEHNPFQAKGKDTRKPEDFYQAMQIISISAEDKQAREKAA